MKKDLTHRTIGRYSYRDIREQPFPNATDTINSSEELIMLQNSIGQTDHKIKTKTFNTSPNVLEGLSYIRKRNEELVEALDHSLEMFEQVLAFYQADAYSS